MSNLEKIPDAIRVDLTPEQVKQLQPLFNFTHGQNGNGMTGLIFAQPAQSEIGNRLVVGFIGNPFAQRMVRLVQAARKAKQASCYVFDIAEFIGRKV